MAFPNANGLDKANAHGQAIINTAVKALMALVKSVNDQNAKALSAMANKKKVK